MDNNISEETEIRIKELIADRIINSARFLFECFIDTEKIEVKMKRKGTHVVTEIAGETFYTEPVENFESLMSKYMTFTNVQKKEYGDRESMKMVYSIILRSFAGGHIGEEDIKAKELVTLLKNKMGNYKVLENA